MPTYSAVGITATLGVASLQESLSKVIDLKMGRHQSNDAKRIKEVFTHGHNLPEKSIGPGGSDHGVLQFLGPGEDMPCFMVEVGEHLARPRLEAGTQSGLGPERPRAREDSHVTDVDKPSMQQSDSPLTSLGATPSSGTPTSSRVQNPLPFTPDRASQSRPDSYLFTSLLPDMQRVAEVLGTDQQIGGSSGPLALGLTIELCAASFLPPLDHSRYEGSDLKLEVFVNGELAGSTLINKRGSAIDRLENKIRFQGVRVSRQMEQPWVYDPEAARRRSELAAPARWGATCQALMEEVSARGINRNGGLAPSAELLLALSQHPLPLRLESKNSLGIIDLVITAGRGKKHGPDRAYITAPARLEDARYTPLAAMPIVAGNDISSDGIEVSDGAAMDDFSLVRAPPTLPHQQAISSSPEIPLMRQFSASGRPETPSKKVLDVHAAPIDLTTDTQPSASHVMLRSIRQITGTTETDKVRNLAALREELDGLQLPSANIDMTLLQPSSKRIKLHHQTEAGPSLPANASYNDVTGPFDVFNVPSVGDPMFPSHVDPIMHTQARIDTALSGGAAFAGTFLRRIAASSPLSSPSKITRASSLANSPCCSPLKSPKRNANAVKTFVQPDTVPSMDSDLSAATSPPPHDHTSSIVKDVLLEARSGEKSGPPKESTPQATLQQWRMPALAKGSSLTFMEDDSQGARQVAKARSGAFAEESLAVGMRFVVN